MARKRQFSLFVKSEGRYRRIAKGCATLDGARMLFQSKLLNGSIAGFDMFLRPVLDGYVNNEFVVIPRVDEDMLKSFNAVLERGSKP